jgi:hypothetical protein
MIGEENGLAESSMQPAPRFRWAFAAESQLKAWPRISFSTAKRPQAGFVLGRVREVEPEGRNQAHPRCVAQAEEIQ